MALRRSIFFVLACIFIFAAVCVVAKSKFSLYSTTALDCNRPWPDMDLFLPVHLMKSDPRKYEWRNILLRSLFRFWPLSIAKVGFIMIVNEEMKGQPLVVEAEKIMSELSGSFSRSVVKYSSQNPYYRTGHDRQQHMMMHADEYSSAPYIAFVDTDCFFQTYVDREDLFEDGKPVINGRYGMPQYGVGDFWDKASNSTYLFTGEKEVMRCMSYFPVIIKREHLKLMREFIERVVCTS